MLLSRLQFEYKGRTSTLHSSTDIAAWIEERKKKFPTQARAAEAAERKRQREQAQRAANLARKDAQEKQRLEAKERQRIEAEAEEKRKKPKDAQDAAAKAKRKVEKLRKQLEKEERRVAKAEAKALKSELGYHEGGAEVNTSKKRRRSCSEASSNANVVALSTIDSKDQADTSISQSAVKAESDANVSQAPVKAAPDVEVKIEDSSIAGLNDLSSNDTHPGLREVTRIIPDPLTPTSQPPDPGDEINAKIFSIDRKDSNSKGSNQAVCKTLSTHGSIRGGNIDGAIQDRAISRADSSSETISTDSDDLTSSSGSSSTLSDSDDDAPDVAPSKRNGPEIVAPPKREKPKGICRNFLASGRCNRGDSCRYRHELPERGSRGADQKDEKRSQGKTERVGLHQRVSVIIRIRPNGFL